jgi:hypothetical protein
MDNQVSSQAQKESQAHILAEKVLFTPPNASPREEPIIMKGRILPCDEDNKKDSKSNPTKVKALKKLYGF